MPSNYAKDAYRSGASRSLLVFFMAFGVVITGMLIQAALQFGLHTPRSAGLCDLVSMKKTMGRSLDEPKVLLIGGSGTTLGLRASALEEDIKVPVRNFGLQASLGPRVILGEAIETLRTGDVAILFLEYPHYTYSRPKHSAVEAIMGCGDAHFDAFNLTERVQFLLGVSPMRWFELKEPTGERGPGTLDEFGDRRIGEEYWKPISEAEAKRMSAYQPINIRFDSKSDGVRSIQRFVEEARSKGVLVLASWPNTIAFDVYLENENVAEIESFYESIDVKMIGDISLGLYPLDAFHDTQYHLNQNGIGVRTSDFTAELENSGALKQIYVHMRDGMING